MSEVIIPSKTKNKVHPRDDNPTAMLCLWLPSLGCKSSTYQKDILAYFIPCYTTTEGQNACGLLIVTSE